MTDVRTTTRHFEGMDVQIINWTREDRVETEMRIMVHPDGSATVAVKTGDSNVLTHVPPEALLDLQGAFMHADHIVWGRLAGSKVESLRGTGAGRELADALDAQRRAA